MLDQTAHNPVPTVYAAIELSKKSWVVAIVQPAKGQPSIYRIKGGAFSDLVMRLRTATPGGERLLVCYEAGYDGFWLARSLQTEKIDCRVLDPASLQVNRRARRVKTDRIDVLMLLRALIAVDRGGPACLLDCSCSDHRRRRRTPLASRTPTADSRAHRTYQPHQRVAFRARYSRRRAEIATFAH